MRRHLGTKLPATPASSGWLTASANASSPATLFVSLNVPGLRKVRPGTAPLFRWVLGRLGCAFPSLTTLCRHRDALGPFAVLRTDRDAREAKRICVRIEAERPHARLVDIDVYDGMGRQVDRVSLGLRARRCLACHRPAAECMRLKRHESEQIAGIANELLADCSD